MNTNHKIYYYKKGLPLSLLPFLFFIGLVVFALFVVVGLFVGVVVVAVVAGLALLRLLMPSGKKGSETLEDDGRTIVLEKGEYEVLGRMELRNRIQNPGARSQNNKL